MTEPTYQIIPQDLQDAIRTEISACRLRLDPTSSDVGQLYQTWKEQGHELVLGENGLELKNATLAGITPRDLILNASRDAKLSSNFVLNSGRITHLSQLSRDPVERAKQSVAYVNEFGADAWGKLVRDSAKPALDPSVVITGSMSAHDWGNLRQSEKVKAIAAWGNSAPEIVARICNRKAKK